MFRPDNASRFAARPADRCRRVEILSNRNPVRRELNPTNRKHVGALAIQRDRGKPTDGFTLFKSRFTRTFGGAAGGRRPRGAPWSHSAQRVPPASTSSSEASLPAVVAVRPELHTAVRSRSDAAMTSSISRGVSVGALMTVPPAVGARCCKGTSGR